MKEISVSWIKCDDDVWCSFEKVNLTHDHFIDLFGVYVIWGYTKANIPRAVRLGQGTIKDRIGTHRDNKEITKFSGLKVTWAKVSKWDTNGVEAYLANVLNPIVGDRFPDTEQIKVNLPDIFFVL